jgi:predicted transcriptional regulator
LKIQSLDLTKIDWEKIDSEITYSTKQNSFSKLISWHGDLLSEVQINQIAESLFKSMQKNGLSIKTVDLLFDSLGNNINKIEENLLENMINYVLNKNTNENILIQSLTLDSFDNIFNSVVTNKNANFLIKLKEEVNYDKIAKESRILIDKKLLDNSLVKNNLIKSKKIKL